MALPTTATILIVGAGPVGLTAAIELARRGYRPRIVAANDGPVHQSRALAVNQRTLQILEPSGASARILAAGQAIGGLHLHTADRDLVDMPLPDLGRLPFMYILAQSEIEAILVDVLRGYGVEVGWRTELTRIADPEGRPTVSLTGRAGEETLAVDTVVAADGAHSAIRHQLGLNFAGSAYETEWGLADVRVTSSLPLTDAHAFDLAPVLVVLIPIRGNLVRLICDHVDVLQHVPPQFKVEKVEWVSPFRISHRQVDSYQKGNVFLAGDAAHIHSPIGARGMNLGIEDAAWLAWMIAEGTTAGYTEARKPAGRRVIRLVDPATRLMSSDGFLPKLIRRRILPTILGNAAIRTRLMRNIVAGTQPPPWLADRE